MRQCRSKRPAWVFCLLLCGAAMGLTATDANARKGIKRDGRSSNSGGVVVVPRLSAEKTQETATKAHSATPAQAERQSFQASAFERARRTLEAERSSGGQISSTPANTTGTSTCLAGCYR